MAMFPNHRSQVCACDSWNHKATDRETCIIVVCLFTDYSQEVMYK